VAGAYKHNRGGSCLQTRTTAVTKAIEVDPGQKFTGTVSKEMEQHSVSIRRGILSVHRDQAIVERFNRTLAERPFGDQFVQEMRLSSDQRSTERGRSAT